jgi:hypothetical protein
MVIMKKSMILLGCLALLAAGCNKFETVEVPEEEPVVKAPDHLVVDITVGTEDQTRAVKSGWKYGDKIYVFFDHFFLDYVTDPNIGTTGYSDDVCYLTLTYDGATWQSTFSQAALETYLLGQSSGTLAAVYYQNLDPQFKGFHSNRGVNNTFGAEVQNYHQNYGCYLYTAQGSTYTVMDGNLVATLNMHLNDRSVYFFVPGIKKSARFGLGLRSPQLVNDSAPNKISSTSYRGGEFGSPYVSFYPTESDFPVLYPNFEDQGLNQQTSRMAFYGRLKSEYVGQSIEYVLQLRDKREEHSYKDDLNYTLTKTATLNGKEVIELPDLHNATAWVRSHANNTGGGRGFINGVEWILMGDGRKWAARNFGEVDDFTDSDVEGSGGYGNMWADVPTFLQREWGSGWRLPTVEEWDAVLVSKNHSKHVKVYDDDGSFLGVRVERWNEAETYEVDHLFLPARPYSDVNFNILGEPDGFYWIDKTGANDTAFAMRLEANPPDGYPFSVYNLPKNSLVQTRAILDE